MRSASGSKTARIRTLVVPLPPADAADIETLSETQKVHKMAIGRDGSLLSGLITA
jgi:hypothetical protein